MLADIAQYSDLIYTGYTQDALKELSEAHITYALVTGQPLPTPEQLRQDESVPWQSVGVFAAGRERQFQIKTLESARWRGAGALGGGDVWRLEVALDALLHALELLAQYLLALGLERAGIQAVGAELEVMPPVSGLVQDDGRLGADHRPGQQRPGQDDQQQTGATQVGHSSLRCRVLFYEPRRQGRGTVRAAAISSDAFRRTGSFR
jgi:hypothetical protein